MRVRYLHSDIDTVEQVEIIRDLRLGEFDVLVGINLLRKDWICRRYHWWQYSMRIKRVSAPEGSLIQTIGRAARNVNGKAILYAEKSPVPCGVQWMKQNAAESKQKTYNE